jgi:hypothetical protein
MTILDTNGYLDPAQPMRMRNGEDHGLEEQAASWLAKSREGVTALRDKHDYLTRDQLANRYKKEVFNSNGFSDESLMSGLFRRAYNPLAGSRPSRRSHAGEE